MPLTVYQLLIKRTGTAWTRHRALRGFLQQLADRMGWHVPPDREFCVNGLAPENEVFVIGTSPPLVVVTPDADETLIPSRALPADALFAAVKHSGCVAVKSGRDDAVWETGLEIADAVKRVHDFWGADTSHDDDDDDDEKRQE